MTKSFPYLAMDSAGKRTILCGRARSFPVESVSGATLKQAIRDNVNRNATIMTDEWPSYRGIGTEFNGGHHFVTHSAGEYARGDASTNLAESYFALLKRGITGSFHHISKQHMHRYCNEFSFRWDYRKASDSERTTVAIRQSDGRRLLYKERV